MRMKERLYLTEDRSRVVKEDDRSGRHLLCKKGAELDDEIALEYGLVDGGLDLAIAKQVSKAMQKKFDGIAAAEVKRTRKKPSSKSTRVKKVETKSTGRVVRFGGSKRGGKK